MTLSGYLMAKEHHQMAVSPNFANPGNNEVMSCFLGDLHSPSACSYVLQQYYFT